jgi:hypothetical protein
MPALPSLARTARALRLAGCLAAHLCWSIAAEVRGDWHAGCRPTAWPLELARACADCLLEVIDPCECLPAVDGTVAPKRRELDAGRRRARRAARDLRRRHVAMLLHALGDSPEAVEAALTRAWQHDGRGQPHLLAEDYLAARLAWRENNPWLRVRVQPWAADVGGTWVPTPRPVRAYLRDRALDHQRRLARRDPAAAGDLARPWPASDRGAGAGPCAASQERRTAMTEPTSTAIQPAEITAEDLMAVLAAAGGGFDTGRLSCAAQALTAAFRAQEAAEAAWAAELRGRLRAASAQASDLAAECDRQRAKLARLRQAVRCAVLNAINNGALSDLLEEVDEAFREWGMPGLPRRYAVTARVPFSLTVAAADAAQATASAPVQLWLAACYLPSCRVGAYAAQLDPPQPLASAASSAQPAPYRVTGRAPVTVTVRAQDPREAAARALPALQDALSALPDVIVATEAIEVTSTEDAGFDPDIDPDHD